MALMLDGLDLLGTQDRRGDGEPMLLPVDVIDEDPGQPRLDFDEEPLRELAETIRERGVRQPVSVRPNPLAEGRWLLNFGARRLRASKLAGRAEIPAFVDLSADSYDQVIENEQHERLKPLELALFIQRRLAAGDIQAEIARRMGKGRQYVTMAMALVDAPDWLLAAYRDGRCRGLNELHELRKLATQHSQLVKAWVSELESITRDKIAALRENLARREGHAMDAPDAVPPSASPVAASATPAPSDAASSAALTPAAKSARRGKPVLQARLEGVVVVLDTGRAPPTRGQVYVHTLDHAEATPVDAARLVLIGFRAN